METTSNLFFIEKYNDPIVVVSDQCDREKRTTVIEKKEQQYLDKLCVKK
jgi:hypothetical protein